MASGYYSVGQGTVRTNSWDEEVSNSRQNHPNEKSRESKDDLRASGDDPFYLDTDTLLLTVTNLQQSCKKFNKLKTKLEKKRRNKEEKKKYQKGDSKDFKEKTQYYYELYKDILIQRASVESIFDKSERKPYHKEGGRQIASERQKQKNRPPLPHIEREKCETCQKKETMIWKLETDIKKSKSKIAELEEQIAIEKSAKEDALRRLSSIASAKLRDNNPHITDLSDPNRPSKIAEKLSEIYDNEWTDAFEFLEQDNKNHEENIQLLLNVLMDIHQQFNKQSEDILSTIMSPLKPTDIPPNVSKNVKDAVKMLAQYKTPAVAKDIKGNLTSKFANAEKLFQHTGDIFNRFVDNCIDVCLLMSVQDPPMCLSAVPSENGLYSQNLYRAYTKSGKYEKFIVWPVLYLHKNGPVMSKGVAQGADNARERDHGQQNKLVTTGREKKMVSDPFDAKAASDLHSISALGIKQTTQLLSSMASAKFRDNNPNLADRSDLSRPTKIAEKLSEIYDNEWKDAFEYLEKYSTNQEENIQLLLNVLMEIHQQCNKQSKSILSTIMSPLDVKRNLSFRLANAGKVFQHTGDIFNRFVDNCIEVCLLMSSQDPPMCLSAVPSNDGLYSQHLYRAYTKSGKYEKFIVWPVLYLHKNGSVMTKGVAEGTDIMTNSSQSSSHVATRHNDNAYRQQHNLEQDRNQPASSRPMATSQYYYNHRQQHNQMQDWTIYNKTKMTHGLHGQGYSKQHFNKTFHTGTLSSQSTDF